VTVTHPGVDTERVDALLARARREVDEGLLPSCQVALAKDGELIAFEAFGDSTTDTRYAVFSCTKAFVAAAMWVLIGEGKVDVSRRVVDYVPEFGTNRKDVVTVEQVMLHTSGFPHAPLGPPQWYTHDGRMAAFEKWRFNWEPGTRYEYHPTSAHWVLAEIIQRVTAADFRDVVQERVTDPAGLPDRVLGVPPERQRGIATLEVRGEPPTPDELEAIFGMRELPVTEVTDEALLHFNEPEVRALGVPGGGAFMTAADLARFYQVLLHDRDGIFDPAVLADATGRVRNRFPDPMTGVPANRTLGLIQAGDDGKAAWRGLGHTASARSFGHNGAGGQLAWGDPATGLSLGYVTNGLDDHVIRQARRGVGIASRAGACVEA
jgi:CubicO group peptidase (beta-lactamase class C family)